MDLRDLVTRHSQGVAWLYSPSTRPTGRCPVQSITPLGPDQVNALSLLLVLAWVQASSSVSSNRRSSLFSSALAIEPSGVVLLQSPH
jgi:hypothetical protein